MDFTISWSCSIIVTHPGVGRAVTTVLNFYDTQLSLQHSQP